jgi:hypothetical protein
MTAAPSEILAVAAKVWDQDSHTDAEMAFLTAIAKADSQWIARLDQAKLDWDGFPKTWEGVRYLATRQRNAEYANAYAALEASDDEENEIFKTAVRR